MEGPEDLNIVNNWKCGCDYQGSIYYVRKSNNEDVSLGNSNHSEKLQKTILVAVPSEWPGLWNSTLRHRSSWRVASFWIVTYLMNEARVTTIMVYANEEKSCSVPHHPKFWLHPYLFFHICLNFSKEPIINSGSFLECSESPGFTFGFCFVQK